MLIAQTRRKAIADIDLAKKLAREKYFSRYTPAGPMMKEVAVTRFAVADGKTLPPDAGLYVHQPVKAGKGHYAVVACVNGVANLSGF